MAGATASNPTIRAVIDPSGAVNGAQAVVRALQQISNAANNNGLSSVNTGLNGITQAAAKTNAALAANTAALNAATNASNSLSSQMAALATSMNQTGAAAHQSSSQHSGLAGELRALTTELLGAYLGFEGLKKAMELSDEVSGMTAKLRLATDGWGDFVLAQQQVNAISASTRSDLISTGELYGTLARGADGLGVSQNGVARATQTITEAFKVSGVSSRMASTAVMELSEAFGAGVLQGNHLKILMSDAPRLAKVLADSLGVPTNRLREMGAQGKLTSQMLIDAFTSENVGAKLDAEFQTMPKTFGDVGTEIKNLAAQLAYATTSSGDLASKVFDGLNVSASALMPIFETLGSGLGQIFDSIGSAFSSAYDALTSIGDGTQQSMTATQGFQVALHTTADVISSLVSMASEGFNLTVQAIELVREALTGLSTALGGASSQGVQSAKDQALAWIGLANEVKVFTMGMSSAFEAAFASIGDMFSDVEGRAKKFFSGDFQAFSGIGDSLTKEFSKGHNAIKGLFDAANNAGSKAVAGVIFDHITGADKPAAKVGDGTGTTRKVAPEEKEDKKAEAVAARLAKRMSEFWASLDNNKNEEQAYGQQLEINNKVFEYRKIVGDKITQQDQLRIANAIKEKSLNDAIAKLKQDTANNKMADDQTATRNGFVSSQQASMNAIAQAATAGKSGMDAMVARAQALGDAQKKAAGDLRVYDDVQAKVLADQQKGVDTTSAAYQAALKLYQIEVARKDNLAHISDELGKGQALIDKFDPTSKNAAEKSGYLDNIKSIQLDAQAGNVDGDAAKRAISAINDEIYKLDHSMQTQWGDAIDKLGQDIKGKWGDAISGVGKLLQSLVKGGAGDYSDFGAAGQIVGLFSKDSNGATTKFGGAVQDSMKKSLDDVFSGDTWAKPFKSMSDGFSSFQGDMKGIFGKGGDLTKSLGDLAGKGLAGAKVGAITDDVLGALGVKSSKTGAELGGAAGMMLGGPVGSLLGSLGGGIIGGLFKAVQKGGTTISYGANGVASTNTFGNNSSMEEASSGAATSVISGIQSVASQLGALFSGDGGGITIGQYKGNWRVNTETSKLGGSSSPVAGLTDFGDDESAAVEYAIKAALDKGVLSGLDAMTQKIIRANSDLDTALAIAKQWQTVAVDQKFAGQGIQDQLVQQDALNKSLATLQQELEAAGASAADMSTFYAYAQEQAAKGLKDLLSPLKSLQDTLDGAGGGVTELNQLTTKMATLSQYQATLAGGGTVDTSDFTDIVQSILTLGGDVYGTASSQFQSIRDQLNAANALEMANATQAYNDNLTDAAKQAQATTDAVTLQTNVLSAQNSQILTTLSTIAANTQSSGTTAGGAITAVNGRLTAAV